MFLRGSASSPDPRPSFHSPSAPEAQRVEGAAPLRVGVIHATSLARGPRSDPGPQASSGTKALIPSSAVPGTWCQPFSRHRDSTVAVQPVQPVQPGLAV